MFGCCSTLDGFRQERDNCSRACALRIGVKWPEPIEKPKKERTDLHRCEFCEWMHDDSGAAEKLRRDFSADSDRGQTTSDLEQCDHANLLILHLGTARVRPLFRGDWHLWSERCNEKRVNSVWKRRWRFRFDANECAVHTHAKGYASYVHVNHNN